MAKKRGKGGKKSRTNNKDGGGKQSSSSPTFWSAADECAYYAELGCHIANVARCDDASAMYQYPWLRDIYPFNPEEYDPEDIKSVPEVALDDCHKTLTITNVKDVTNICYVTVYGVGLLDRNGNILTSGISSTTTTTSTPNNSAIEQRKCTTFIITIPPQTFIELCSLAPPLQSTQEEQYHGSWSNVEIESDIQPITSHPYPTDTHLYTMHFPFQSIKNNINDDNNNPTSSCSIALCIQSEKGELTHFFKGNYHAIDFACPIGTPLYSPIHGTIVSICQHRVNNHNSSREENTQAYASIEVSGIAATNMFQWNSIMIQVADDTNDPLYVEFVHIQTNSCVVQVGDVVHKGQLLCFSGSVGFSPVPHLHMAAYRSSNDDAATVRFRFECVSSEEEEDKDDSICKKEKVAIEEEDMITKTFLPMAGGLYDCNGLRSFFITKQNDKRTDEKMSRGIMLRDNPNH